LKNFYGPRKFGGALTENLSGGPMKFMGSPDIRHTFYTSFSLVEKFGCVLNSRNVYLFFLLLKSTFKNWMNPEFDYGLYSKWHAVVLLALNLSTAVNFMSFRH
jgi:hypothetical protein